MAVDNSTAEQNEPCWTPAPPSVPFVAMAPSLSGHGYGVLTAFGKLDPFGDFPAAGDASGLRLVAPMVALATCPGGGYMMAAADGGIFDYAGAPFYGSMGGHPLNARIVGLAPTASGGGYWLVAADGGIFAFGDAPFFGSMGGQHLNSPVVGMAATPTGDGYWLVAADGGIFAFGDAAFDGSAGSIHLNEPVVGMAPFGSDAGYWLVAGDGGIFTYGDAPYLGSPA
ncbi:MAG TPA: hypothetical protein VG346_03415 [Acidimicrobiales bacterium]|nr:hypothetical protein [Acidimicrobiales bacterium]